MSRPFSLPLSLPAAGLVLVVTTCQGCIPNLSGLNPIPPLLNALSGDTRILYTVKTETAVPIANAELSFYALKTGGDPTVDADYDTIADAVLTTGDGGTALVYVKAMPNEAGDDVVRPTTFYMLAVDAPGFEAVVTHQPKYNEGMGLDYETVALSLLE